MNTKLKSFFVLLLVLGGVKVSWADITHEIKFKSSNSIEASPDDSYFVYNKGEGTAVSWSSGGKHSCTYNGETYSDVIKMEKETQLIFETSSNKSTVTIVQTTSNAVGDKLKFNGVNLDSSMSNTTVTVDETNKCNIYVITNVRSGEHKITRQSETGLAYVKVVEADGSYESEYIVTDKATIDGSERNLQGKFTFTGEGSISGGTVVDDVPGISMTVGAEGNDNWTVVDALAIDGSYPLGSAAAYCPTGANRPTNTTGCFFKFEPVVNGELIVRYYTTNEVYWGTQGENGSKQEGTRIQTKTFLVKAGEKYYLAAKGGGFYLNSFSFRPMFFLVDQSTGALTTTEASKDPNSPFTANMTTAVDRFPHLITTAAGEGIVKFAGDRAVVNLATNNDVTLVGDGSTIIKGTVLHENNVDDLFAYYYLQSNILTLDGTYRLENGGSTPTAIADQAYVTQAELQYGQYQFDFSHDIAATSNYKVYFKRIGIDTDEIDLTTFSSGGNLEISGDKLIVKLNELDEGRTYKIRIPSGSVRHSEDNNVQNAEIIRYFTVKADGEAQVTIIYPSGVGTVATSIVLQAATSAGSTSCNVVKESPVVGTLTAADGTSMTITATFDQNKLVFKPSTALSPNTTYTLSVTANQIKIDTNPNEVVTKNKEFVFTTGAAAGTVPQIVSTTPAYGDVVTARTGTISFVFDQEIDLEPYSHVLATPVNGSEATVSGHSGASGASNWSLNKTATNTISFNYGADDLKYDLYYNLVFPANTITGAGGKANSEPITVRFKVAKNPDATEVNASTFYPHTWDFNKFGDKTVNGSTAYNIINNCGDPSDKDKRINSLYSKTEDGYTTYTTKNQNGYGFDQGNNVYFNNKNRETEVMDEFEGIRISLVDTRSNRFEIRNITSKETSNKNEDGTDKWVFRMNGNTHYMTLSNVPVGKLYMVANSKHIGINSPNATFESVSGSGYTLSNENTVLSTKGTRKIVINVETAGDVSFCVQDFNCEKIGVAVDEKTYNPNFVKDGKTYATDRLGYDVRYDLLNAFTEHAAKTYYVSNLADNASDNTATITATEISNHVAKANEGTLVVYQGAVDVATTVPVFKTDVNTASVEATNSLKVIETGSTSLPSITDGYYMYVLSYRGTKSTGVNFYRYTGSSFSDRAAYLEIPKSWVEPTEPGQGARLLRMVFIDEDGNQTTHIRDLEIAGVSEIDQASGAYYNLRGQRVKTPTTSGLYIRNGKKVYVVK